MGIAFIITRLKATNPSRVEYMASYWPYQWTDDILKATEYPFVDEEQAKGVVMEKTGSDGAGCDFVRVTPKDEMVY
jgi:hypothetical protein